MKKVLLISAFVLVLIAVPVTVLLVKQNQDLRQRALPASRLYIDPATLTKAIGETFTLNLMVDTGENFLAVAKLHLSFNPQYLEAINIQNGTFVDETVGAGVVDPTAGTASITVRSSANEGGKKGTGILAILTLKGKAETTTPVQVQFDRDPAENPPTQAAGLGEGPNDIIIGTQPAVVTISALGASPAPSASVGPQVSPTPIPSVSPGGPSPSATPGTGGGNATPSPSVSASPGQVTKILTPANGSSTTNKRPPITGTSFANALVIVSINTSPVTSVPLTAAASGSWSYTPTSDLSPGTYMITATGEETGTGKIETATASFTITASGGTGGTALASPSPTPPTSGTGTGTGTGTTTKGGVPVTGSTAPTLVLFFAAFLLILLGLASGGFRKNKL